MESLELSRQTVRRCDAGDGPLNWRGEPLREGVDYHTLTHGAYAGMLCADDDPELVRLSHHGYCLDSDDYHNVDGDLFHADQADELGLVTDYEGVWRPRSGCRYGWISSQEQAYFSHHEDFVSGWDVSAGEYTYFLDANVAQSRDYDYSEYHGEYRHRDDPMRRWVSDDDDDDDDYDEDDDQKNADYHNLRRHDLSDDSAWKVGVEVEKEDQRAWKILFRPLYKQTRWCKESDGSLNSWGYELVSPIYDLYSDAMLSDIAASPDLTTLVNGCYSRACGGHMSLSSTEHTPAQLLRRLSPFYPLLYALYPTRAGNSYSVARPIGQLERAADLNPKASALVAHTSRLEIRLFPTPKNVDDLAWRIKLLRYMADAVRQDTNRNVRSVLCNLLRPASSLSQLIAEGIRRGFTEWTLNEAVTTILERAVIYYHRYYPASRPIDAQELIQRIAGEGGQQLDLPFSGEQD